MSTPPLPPIAGLDPRLLLKMLVYVHVAVLAWLAAVYPHVPHGEMLVAFNLMVLGLGLVLLTHPRSPLSAG